MKPKIVVLTGAGMSAESGIATFRASDGLWENHRIEDVASPDGWARNPALVLDFYNQRRRQLATVQPNAGHHTLAAFQDKYEVNIITQNVDDLHERAGSEAVLHLHGILTQGCSSYNKKHPQQIGYDDIAIGHTAADGSQLRPNIVWFGEAVPLIELAAQITATAHVFVVVGTSMQVYPAAGLIHSVKASVPIYVIDPHSPNIASSKNVTFIKEKASLGLAKLRHILAESRF
jgi:NAD-dependent deacetylase